MKYIIKIFITLLLSISNSNLKAQNDKFATVEYNQVLVLDTTSIDFEETKGVLYINPITKQSIYAWKRKNPNSQKEIIKNDDGSVKVIRKNGSPGTDNLGCIAFKSYQNSVICVRQLIDKWYIVSDTVNINWNITNETKTLNEMTLQKAEADFRGRHYIAWFNPAIPIPDGPWKLRGLPGLIIEAYDEKKHVRFDFVGLNMIAQFDEKIEPPTAGDRINFTEYFNKVRTSMEEAPKKFEAMMRQKNLNFDRNNLKTNVIERNF